MKKRNRNNVYISTIMLFAFLLWTLLVRFVDVQAIGPNESTVGFATINKFVHEITGENMILYTITDWLGLVPIFVGFGFAILGLCQWIKRRGICKVDYSILILGGFYAAVIAVYILFEYVVINHRPVLINGFLEVSYPSSTTMLVMCVMPTALMQFNKRIKNRALKTSVAVIIIAFTAFMVIGRLISGVHWFSDIIGGALISSSLVTAYRFFIGLCEKE